MIKKFLVLSIIFILVTTVKTNAQINKMPSTNLDGIGIFPGYEYAEENPAVYYPDGTKEEIDKNFKALFINGSIIKNANLITESNRTLIPLRVVTENLGGKVDWNDKTKTVTIIDGNNNIQLTIGSKKVTLNNKEITLDIAPKIYNNYTYVPARFVAESLNSTVDYYDGNSETGVKIFPRLPHVMISRYPSDVQVLSEKECTEILQKELIIAYEIKFGEFIPLDKGAIIMGDDKSFFRQLFPNLEVKYVKR